MDALDNASDTVCRVYDAAELCRSAAADGAWRAAAADTCAALGSYIHALNTHAPLYGAVKRAQATGTLTGETAIVAAALARDFERAGVHLPPAAAAAVAAGTADALAAGFELGTALADPAAGGAWFSRGGRRVAATPAAVAAALATDADETVRRAAYSAAHAPDQPSVAAIHRLTAARHGVASALGARSWAAHAVCGGGTLAGDDATVVAFLTALARALRPRADAQVAALAAAKRGAGGGGRLEAWDRPYFAAAARAAAAAGAAGSPHYAPPPVPVAAALGGLGDVLRGCVGVALTEVATAPGDAWAPGVLAYDCAAVEGGRPLGRLYVDVVPR